jgi:diguanylate cyclase
MSKNAYQLKKKKGEVIFREDESADCAYLIEEGRIEISVNRDDHSFVLSELGPGEIVGEMAVIDQHERTATATVVEDCLLTVVTPQQIRQRIGDADPVIRSLLSVLLSRYRSELSLEQGLSLPAETTPASQRTGIEKIRLENALRRSLENGDIRVAYQPIRCLRRNETAGFEALVRWQHPDEGSISPESLIALAEETDLIGPLSLYVFKSTVTDFTGFRAAAPGELFASVNVSPRHTVNSEFLNLAWDICAEAGGQPPT